MKTIPIDKQAHFLAGAAIASTVSLYGYPLMGLLLCVVAAVGKELYDATGRGTPDVWDAVVTILGGTVVLPYIFLS
jgi:hypothetical protein